MFDVDSLEHFADRAAKNKTLVDEQSLSVAGGAPKSRGERLRDFYESRQHRSQEVEQKTQVEENDDASPRGGQLAQRSDQTQLRSQPSADEQEESIRLRKRANDLYGAGDYDGAVEFYTAALKQAPSSVLHSNRAAAYMMLGWWDQALRDTRAALRRDPDNLRALERHGKILLAQDKFHDAKEAVLKLQARIPENERHDHKTTPLQLNKMLWLLERSREPSTLEECRTLVAEFGSKAEMVSPLGYRLRRTLVKALVERSDAIDNQRRIRPALARNCQTAQDADEIQEIAPLAEEALQITAELLADNCPEEADIRYWRSKALVRLGRKEDSEIELARGLEDQPDHSQMRELEHTLSTLAEFKSKANESFKAGNLEEAIRIYTRGLDQDPACIDTRTCATLYYNRSAAYRRKGEFERALEDVNLALALHPKWCKALYRRGVLLMECGRYAEALTELKVVQRADPTFDDELNDWLRRAHHWLSKPAGEANYYRYMRLPMDASKDDIRKQYHRLCLSWHPDKSGGTEEGRQRFEDLQQAYKFLIDDSRRAAYDFGIWKDKPVRHHTKQREKVKDSWDHDAQPDDKPYWYHDCLLDEKVESVFWDEAGPPEWLKEKRRQHKIAMLGQYTD